MVVATSTIIIVVIKKPNNLDIADKIVVGDYFLKPWIIGYGFSPEGKTLAVSSLLVEMQ